jgi:hypothetical protein
MLSGGGSAILILSVFIYLDGHITLFEYLIAKRK